MNKFEQFYESVMDDYRKEMNIPSKKTLSPDEYEELSFLFKLVKDSSEKLATRIALASPSYKPHEHRNPQDQNMYIETMYRQFTETLKNAIDGYNRFNELINDEKS
jgi:hypothetical protein